MRAYRADTLSVQRIHAARQAALSISEIRAARAAPAPRAVRVAPTVAPSAPPKKPAPTTRAIIDFVAYQTGLSGAAIIGRDREPRLVRARAAVSWIARAVAGRSTAQIGAVLGGRDYSSIAGQHRHAERLRDSDPAFKLLIERAIDQFSEGNPA